MAIQGLGSVGLHLAAYLRDEGVKLFGCDIDAEVAAAAADSTASRSCRRTTSTTSNATSSPPAPSAPCSTTTPSPACTCKIVAGAANNQLHDGDRHGRELNERGILYAPDFVINAGGLINVYNELTGNYNQERALRMTRGIYLNLMRVFEIAKARGHPHRPGRRPGRRGAHRQDQGDRRPPLGAPDRALPAPRDEADERRARHCGGGTAAALAALGVLVALPAAAGAEFACSQDTVLTLVGVDTAAGTVLLAAAGDEPAKAPGWLVELTPATAARPPPTRPRPDPRPSAARSARARSVRRPELRQRLPAGGALVGGRLGAAGRAPPRAGGRQRLPHLRRRRPRLG